MIPGIRSGAAVTAGCLLAVSTFLSSGALRGQISRTTDTDTFEVLQLRPNFYMIASAGANTASR